MASSSQGKEAANQPLDFNFSKHEFGKTKVVHRAFQAQWFAKWPWLHYDIAQDLALLQLLPESLHCRQGMPRILLFTR